MAVVVAPDSFKHTLSAAGVASAIAAGWLRVRPGDEVRLLPMADGGEGTLDAFEAAVPGARRMPLTVTGPDGEPTVAAWLLLPDGTGVVELASTSGIELLRDGLRPLTAQTVGFGQAIGAAVRHGVERLLLGIGSSASTDGGVGMLRALGAEFLDDKGLPVGPGASRLERIASVDLTGLAPLPPTTVLCDVTNPLLGPLGAATVFGPQKGLDDEGRGIAERGLSRLADLLCVDPMLPGSGAAGGTGMALLALGARLASGAGTLGSLLGLPEAVRDADVVVTGEGSFDAQSLHGKVPGHVLDLAGGRVPVLLAAGRIAPDADLAGFTATVALTELAGGPEAAMTEPETWLREAGARLARALER